MVGDEVETLSYGIGLQNYVNNNNLSLPIPQEKKDNYFYLNNLNSKENFIYLNEFSKPLNEYISFIDENFMYDIESYDCKYWSFVHTLYWKLNKDKYDWKLQYLDTDNHIFVMLYNDSGYAILDQNNLECFGDFC